ncbi:MAG: DUF4126 family protein [Bacteroidetes bacterium]|nr:DUF4126 family protein [Fibrella sp.]
MIQPYVKAAQLGIVAGMRSMMAPALVSRQYARTRPDHLTDSPLAFVTSPRASTLFMVLAGGELIGDKLPQTPNRTTPGSVTGRVSSGALCGAAVARAEGQQLGLGALAGGLGALVSTFAFYQLRHWLTTEKNLPDVLVALAEDALAVSAGLLVLRGDQPGTEST